MTRKGLVVAAVLLALGGCARPTAYQRVFGAQERSMNRRTMPATGGSTWAAVKRAALALNFSIDEEDQAKGRATASRLFQDGRKTTKIQLKAEIEPDGSGQTVVFLSAIEETDRLFTRSHRRFFLWIIPLPGGGGVEANRVTETERTIVDQDFYDSFFAAVERELALDRTHSAAP